MKTFKIAPRKGMVKTTIEQLEEAGKPFTGVVLKAGQVIQFPTREELDTHMEPLGKSKVHCVNVILDGVPSWIPFGSFNKTPHGNHAIEFLEKFDTNREICGFGSFRVAAEAYCAKAAEGKSLRVKEIFVGQKPLYKKAADGSYEYGRNEDNSVATQPGNFPVFEWINTPE